MSFITKIFGDPHVKLANKYKSIVDKVNLLEEQIEKLSSDELKGKTRELKLRLEKGDSIDDILPEAFALVREASRRTLGQRHFDVQILGGIILHKGHIAEMKTGEGKTLVATLPVYLNALTGKGVHVITVNDYLSRRDAVWMGQIYNALGLTIGVINHEISYLYDETLKKLDEIRDEKGSFHVVHEFLKPVTRKDAYNADITYGTNHEFGFDYLRDNLEYKSESLRQRDLHYAVVDEIDSILIDEARTPLIISSATNDAESLYKTFTNIVRNFVEGEDYTVEEKHKSISLLPKGIEKAEKSLGVGNIYTEGGMKYVHHLETATRARALYKKDTDYVVKDGEVIIVDSFTGRLQPGRRWSEGLHQAIESKEGLKIAQESRTFASITYQNYFRMYKKLCGMTGTASTSSEEFFKVYGLEVATVPTNKPIARIDRDDLIFQTEAGKFRAIARTIKELNKKGQPVLVGTVAIEKNELLSKYLITEGVKHEILNAKNHEREAEIVAQAGRKGAVTIATNMAGRGVDIKLGGKPSTKDAYEEIKNIGGLFVLGTERHEARRIDNQLRGRSGRQGDPGETQFYVSLEDSLMRVFASDTVKGLMGKLGVKEDEPIRNSLITRALESAQTKIEGFNFDSRKHVLEYDDVLNHQRKSIYERRRLLLLSSNNEVKDLVLDIVGKDEEIEKSITEKISLIGEEAFYKTLRIVALQSIDLFWVEHLETMDYLRNSVNLRAYAQRDPLVEYKKEGLQLFRNLERNIGEYIRNIIMATDSKVDQPSRIRLSEVQSKAEEISTSDLRDNKSKETIIKSVKEVGRNDPCPCGSINPETGKVYKYKQCGLVNAPEHKK